MDPASDIPVAMRFPTLVHVVSLPDWVKWRSSPSSLLQVGRGQTSVLCDSRKNARTEFLVVVKGEDEVRPIRTRERAV
jgi:hypothetical protein